MNDFEQDLRTRLEVALSNLETERTKAGQEIARLNSVIQAVKQSCPVHGLRYIEMPRMPNEASNGYLSKCVFKTCHQGVLG